MTGDDDSGVAVLRSMRIRALVGLLVLATTAACGGSTGQTVPVLHLRPQPTSPIELAQAFQQALPEATWQGGWRFETNPAWQGTEAQAASVTLGSPTKTKELNKDEFQSVTGLVFNIIPDVDNQPGNGGLTILRFATATGAQHFYRAWQGHRGTHLPGVLLSTYNGKSQPSACPGSSCSLGGFVLSVGRYVIDGGLNCTSRDGCTQLAEALGQSVFRSLSSHA